MQVNVLTSAAATIESAIYKNGLSVTFTLMNIGGSSNALPSSSDIVYLNGTTDYIEAYGYQSSGTSGSFNGNTSITYMAAHLIG